MNHNLAFDFLSTQAASRGRWKATQADFLTEVRHICRGEDSDHKDHGTCDPPGSSARPQDSLRPAIGKCDSTSATSGTGGGI